MIEIASVAALSISSWVLNLPIPNLREAYASFSGCPKAVRTWEGAVELEEQAEPDDTATVACKPSNNAAPSTLSTLILRLPGKRWTG